MWHQYKDRAGREGLTNKNFISFIISVGPLFSSIAGNIPVGKLLSNLV